MDAAAAVQRAERVARYVNETIRPSRGGEPVCAFIYDLQALRDHARKCASALPEGCRLYYAVKANPDPAFIACLAPHVYGFEAASIGEIRAIRGVSPDCPIGFGGPCKKDSELEEALALGVKLIHAESLHELRRLDWLAGRQGVKASVLLRVNLRRPLPDAPIAMGGRPTQFGIDEADIPEALALIERLPSLRLEGFHMHSLSNNLDAGLHARMVETYLRCAREWIRDYGLDVKYVNAGGGFGVSYAEEGQPFEWGEFAAELGRVSKRSGIPGTELLFEPGRYLAAACGYYAAEVVDLKSNHGKHYAILRGGTHHFRLPASWRHNQPFEIIPVEEWSYPFPREWRAQTVVTLAGELCTPKDVLASDAPVERIRTGDIVLFHLAGAYGWTISHRDFLGHPYPDFHYLND